MEVYLVIICEGLVWGDWIKYMIVLYFLFRLEDKIVPEVGYPRMLSSSFVNI